MHDTSADFIVKVAPEHLIRGRNVLEVGAYNVNGSARDLLEPLEPSRYMGIDLQPQDRYVDEVLDGCHLTQRFDDDQWDVIVCVQVLEHCEDWRCVVHNIKQVLRPGGLAIIAAPGPPCPYHEYPHDYWRFTTGDAARIFSDFNITRNELDLMTGGFMLAAIKPSVWLPTDLRAINAQPVAIPEPPKPTRPPTVIVPVAIVITEGKP